MKKIISFKKELEFSSMIGEVTAISLDQDLAFVDESNITGNFKISGKYKLTEASRIEEDFEFKIPAEILLSEKLDLTTTKIDVSDFYYEIENDDTMICYIDVKVEGLEQIEETPLATPSEDKKTTPEADNRCIEEDDRCTEDDPRCIEEDDVLPTPITEKNNETTKGEITMQTKEENYEKSETESATTSTTETTTTKEVTESISSQSMGSLFSSFKDSDETFSTYSIYILRQEETLQSIIEKYNTTKEELEKYNDLSSLTVGTKLIIPTSNE